MPNIQHSVLTTTDLHEPKGVSTATEGQTYVADGAGSGAWEKIDGWGQYQDTDRTEISPSQNIATGVRTLLTCDGGFLTTEKLPSDATESFWNTSTNKHIPIAENDTYDIRVSMTLANYSGTAPYVTLELDIGGSIGVILEESKPLLRGSGDPQALVFGWDVFTGSTYLANGGSLYITYTGTGSVDIYKTSLKIERKSRSA